MEICRGKIPPQREILFIDAIISLRRSISKYSYGLPTSSERNAPGLFRLASVKTTNLKSHTTSEMNWNIYFQAFTVRTWRKRLSNLNTFLTPHIYWGIHITICVNYNQHMVEVIPVRFPPPASWKRMSTSVLQWLLNSCLKTEALLLS